MSVSALVNLTSDTNHVQEPTLQAYAYCHLATALRRSGRVSESLNPAHTAIQLAPLERDPYLALNAAANLAYADGLLSGSCQSALESVSEQARTAGLRFVELKARLFAAVLAHASGEERSAVDLLEDCLPRQLALGHINLVAQELCPRPDLVSRVIRRHRTNGLGPALLEALSHHWLFPEAAVTLRELGPSQIGTWLGHLDAKAPAGSPKLQRGQRGQPTGAPGTPPQRAALVGQLSRRERDVLELMAQDRSNDQIATELFIAVSTVKTHVNHILRKLGQTTRVGAVLEYQRLLGSTGNPAVHLSTSSSPPCDMTPNPPWV